MPDLTLWNIEAELADLVNLRDQMAEAGEDLVPIENTIREYVAREIRKVDGIRGYLKHAEMIVHAAKNEAKLQNDRANAWQARIDRLKDFCRFVMEGMPWAENKPRRIEGKTGALVLKMDGGRQTVEITDISLIPDEMVTYQGTIDGGVMYHIREVLAPYPITMETIFLCMERVPHRGRIGEALSRKCHRCNGNGIVEDQPIEDDRVIEGELPCKECGGDGLARVPGARLVPRGQHIEIK